MTKKISKEICEQIQNMAFDLNWKEISAFRILEVFEEEIIYQAYQNNFENQLSAMQTYRTIYSCLEKLRIIHLKQIEEEYNTTKIFREIGSV